MKTQSVEQDALARAAASREADLADLVEELKIASVSTLPERREDCLRNARWLRDRFKGLGFETEIVDVMEKGLPVVVADWNGRPGQPHLTIYGHYDVQPPDPMNEWKSLLSNLRFATAGSSRAARRTTKATTWPR